MIRPDAAQNRAEEFAWKAHPFRERLPAGILASTLILALAGVMFVSMGPAWSVVTVLVLILALNRFFFPSRFEIDRDGVAARYLLSRKRYAWSSVRRFLWDERGAFLSTRGRRSWLDAYSGLTVLFGPHRAEVLKLIHRHMDASSTR
jgi:hypothetical protein